MIPGLDDYYNSLNAHMVHQMEQAVHAQPTHFDPAAVDSIQSSLGGSHAALHHAAAFDADPLHPHTHDPLETSHPGDSHAHHRDHPILGQSDHGHPSTGHDPYDHPDDAGKRSDSQHVHIHSHIHQHHDDSGHSDGHGSLWLPALAHGAASAALKFVGELAFDEVISQVMLAGPSTHDASAHHSHVALHSHHGTPLHVGTPEGSGFTHQTTGFTCAVVSQKMILDQFHLTDPHTGAPVSEAQLVYDATVNGWLSDHGTSLENLDKLLEHYGVSTHAGHDWQHLVNDLAAGHQVVVAVNADSLWDSGGLFSDLMHAFCGAPNHALVLKGMRVDDHGKVMIVVNDPGQADGAGVEYPLDHFQSSLGPSTLHYVATDDAPPGWSV